MEPLQKASTSQKCKNNWCWAAQPQLTYLRHNLHTQDSGSITVGGTERSQEPEDMEVCCETVPRSYDREAILMKAQQHGYHNNTWTPRMTAHNPMYTEKYPMKLHPQMKNYKQLTTAERGQINFSHCHTQNRLRKLCM